MSEFNDSAAVSATIKAGVGYEAPWLVFRGNTAAEVLAQLQDEKVGDLAAQLAKDAVSFQGIYQTARGGLTAQSAAVTDAVPAQQYQQQAAPAAAPQGAAGVAPQCQHGAKVYREAKPGSGKSWKAWFCPAAKGTPGQCPPDFIR